jgi:hypothetical protein
MSGTGTTFANGGLTLSGGNNRALSSRALVNAASAIWSGTGGVSFSNGAAFTNSSTGTFDIQASAALGGDGAVISNAGTFRKSAGTGTATVNGEFTNTGTLGANVGTLSLGGDLENNGEVDVSSGAALGVNGVFYQAQGTLNLNGGTLTVTTGDRLLDLEGGVLNGTGTINANVLNAAQVNPGGDGTAGTLTINGSFTQATGGVLSIDLGGTGATQYDQLHVNGAVSLDGTLTVHLINGFSPAAGNTFQILTFTSASGDFAVKNFPSLGGGLMLVENLGSTSLSLQAQ